jgi:hypothetical protein
VIKLQEHQKKAVKQLKPGSILWGGVGSGKSMTALAYFYTKECGGSIEEGDLKRPKDLYIITTAAKRDSLEWEAECAIFGLGKDRVWSISNIAVVIDSWNNITKYVNVKDAFFIFDEQKVIGSGTWVKSFITISKSNKWILLTATPGDTWSDYIPVFVANGFYKNRTEFIRRHVVYNTFTKFPKIDRYVDTNILEAHKHKLLVKMNYTKKTISNTIDIFVPYDKELMEKVKKERWNPFTNAPIKTISEYCYTARKVVNSSIFRLEGVKELAKRHSRVIVFYNFDYELEALRTLAQDPIFNVAEYNGHYHEEIPDSVNWIYLVQYMSGAEGWNCVLTNTVIFYSLSYSYKQTVQAAGRIDRMNTPFNDLYYYYFTSESQIDKSIRACQLQKKDFNEYAYEFNGVFELASDT